MQTAQEDEFLPVTCVETCAVIDTFVTPIGGGVTPSTRYGRHLHAAHPHVAVLWTVTTSSPSPRARSVPTRTASGSPDAFRVSSTCGVGMSAAQVRRSKAKLGGVRRASRCDRRVTSAASAGATTRTMPRPQLNVRSISVSDARDAFASQPKTCGGDHDGASTSAAIAAGRTRGRFSRRPAGTWHELGGENTWRGFEGTRGRFSGEWMTRGESHRRR